MLRRSVQEHGLGICDTLVALILGLKHALTYSSTTDSISTSMCLLRPTNLDICRNGRGYDVAKEHRHKFTHISPVWFQLKVENEAPTLTGGHDVDAEWMGALRAKPAKVSLQQLHSYDMHEDAQGLGCPCAASSKTFALLTFSFLSSQALSAIWGLLGGGGGGGH